MENNPARLLWGSLLGLTGVIIFSASLPMTKIAVADLDPWFVTFVRATIAGIAGISLLFWAPRPKADQWPDLIISGLCLIFAFPGFMAIGMLTVSASHGGVVIGILPLGTAVAATVLAGEKPSLAFWFWAVAGAALVVIFALDGSDLTISVGDLWLFASAICCSIGYAYSGRLSRSMPGWAVIAWSVTLVLPINLGLSLWFWPETSSNVPFAVWASVGYLGLFSMFIGFFAWNAGLAIGGVARVGQIQLTQTFFTIAIAALLLSEPIESRSLIFACLVAAAVLFGRRAKIAVI